MGTNYYLHHKGACPHCKSPHEPLHIGKSSMGWCFSLHVIPELGINDLEDWQKLWSEPGAIIEDEYGEVISPEKMLAIITERKAARSVEEAFRTKPAFLSSRYRDIEDFYHLNDAEPGPNDLLRHRISNYGHCVKHGAGTWDCIEGTFS